MAKRKKPPPQDDPEQSRRFIEAAHELETDQSGRSFDRVVQPQTLTNTKSPPPKPRGGGKRE